MEFDLLRASLSVYGNHCMCSFGVSGVIPVEGNKHWLIKHSTDTTCYALQCTYLCQHILSGNISSIKNTPKHEVLQETHIVKIYCLEICIHTTFICFHSPLYFMSSYVHLRIRVHIYLHNLQLHKDLLPQPKTCCMFHI